MMWLVVMALRRPYTFVVMALLIFLLGGYTIVNTSKDVFPVINIPVVSIIWSYAGMSPSDMEKRIVTVNERAMTTTVNGIEHIESQSFQGVTVIKVFFHPNTEIAGAVAQVTGIEQTLLRIMPPGITPPLIMQYNASSVPIMQLGISSKTLSEQQIFDLTLNFFRTQMATVQGAQMPLPYGGKQRQIMVDIDTQALFSKGLTANDLSAAINAQNLIEPAGTAKMGTHEYNVTLNSSPDIIEEFNRLPIKEVNGAMVYVGDVAHVHDGNAPQVNIVHEDGNKCALLTVLKAGSASTLDVVKRVKDRLPFVMTTLPKALKVSPLMDQSIFVKASINGVVREAIIAAMLTAAMILVFLGSWRSTVVVATSIPCAIFVSIILLGWMGETLNVMTLGGLALAVGILVDDATVEIENIHRNLHLGLRPLNRAILAGAQQIAVPTFVSTLSICIVFVSVVFLTGPAKFLFTPMAFAVVFAMMASYMLSRTLVPVMVRYLLAHEVDQEDRGIRPSGLIWEIHTAFDRRFEAFREAYREMLWWVLNNSRTVLTAFGAFCAVTLLLLPFIGQDFFPSVDAGELRLHVRCPAGLRVEETSHYFGRMEDAIRELIPKRELEHIIDNIGLPMSGINLAFTDSATIGSNEGEILISLNEDHRPVSYYQRQLRTVLGQRFPDCTFFFQPADIVNQILNFGLPAPIDIQVVGRDAIHNYPIARDIADKVRLIPGAVDVHVHQIVNEPELNVVVDREKAEQIGMQQKDVASDLLLALSGSGQVSPGFWLDPKNGVSYPVVVQQPQYRVSNMNDLMNQPLPVAKSGVQEMLGSVASVHRGVSQQNINHYNVQPTFDVYANVQGRDLGGVSHDVNKVLASYQGKLPRGTQLMVRGQVQSMNSSFVGLGTGLVFAVILVYLLMVVNFQSWLDPFIIITCLPGALCGIIWILFVTHTTFSVPSLMGSIMCIGVATANAILVVTFANDRRHEGDDAITAALAAGYIRIRPVLMTAAAMIIGMLPMAFGFGEGGEQNAPLGRAVIGGLILATITTLIIVPLVYASMRKKPPFTEEPDLLHLSTTEPSPAG
jgi:multidrug efflux pump subunit AcrB